MGLEARESKDEDGNHVSQNGIHGRALVNIVTDVKFTQKAQEILTR
jgi:hypothetical protein